MKCLTLNAIKSPLQLEERPDLMPGPGEVVVQVKAAALNRRDFWITLGMYPGIELPCILGSDASGIVKSCGAGVDQSWTDREIIFDPGLDWGDNPNVQHPRFNIMGLPRDGTFATEVIVPASQLSARPEHLDWIESAALPLAGVTAYRAVFTQGSLQSGETVLVTGVGGGVATFALQFAVAAGANVWVTSSSSAKIDRAVELGAQGGFDYRDEGWWKQMAKDVGAPNLIIDSAGGSGYGALLNLADTGGRIVNYGTTTGAPEKLDLFKLFWKQLHLIGSTMGSPADFRAMLKLVNEHKLRPVVDAVFPLKDGNTAVSRMASSPQFGKYVLTNE
ncbi:MAG: zinc-binding dehydrogenase [Fuerstiella sp.]|nr:zinc-binding dehydrogenase [Fuerstiella sp.]